MRNKDFEQMQRNLAQMRRNLDNIGKINVVEKSRNTKRGRRAVEKKINQIRHPKITKIAKEEQIIVIITIIIVAITCVFSTSIFAKTIAENSTEKQFADAEIETTETTESQNNDENQSFAKEDVQVDKNFVVENNENVIQVEDILMENISVLKSKEYVEEIRPLDFEVKYIQNEKLPEGEEVIIEEGIQGKQQVTAIKSFENNVFVNENILEAIPIEPSSPQKIEIGTSKFLKNNKVHLGDKMYMLEDVVFYESASNSAQEICQINKSIDVILDDLNGEEWCKINYDGLEGYVKSAYLTSSEVTPGIVEANRVQRIKLSLNEEIELNKSTKLTLEDYKKVLSNNPADKNNVISDNAEVFYNIDKAYNMNGIFLASMAIHESAWGTSTISKDKKNLFGYGAYDSSPYQSAFSFESYAEGIDLVAKVLVKYYINETGTPIYENETAKGSYFNGPTVAGVNIRYASDENWHNKVYTYMKYLYNRL